MLKLTDIQAEDSHEYKNMQLISVDYLRFYSMKRLCLCGNHICNLRAFKYFYYLVDLDLSDNDIVDFNQLFYLRNLEQLRQIRFRHLSQNSICLDPNYQTKVLKIIDQIQIIDGQQVAFYEISKALYTNFEFRIPGDLSLQQLQFWQNESVDQDPYLPCDAQQFQYFVDFFNNECLIMKQFYPNQLGQLRQKLKRIRYDLQMTQQLFLQQQQWIKEIFQQINSFLAVLII